MSQRSYSNDRYRKDAKIGSTRKSASKAKPVRKQGTVAETAKKAKPQQEKDWTGLPTSPEIKRWRRVWWALLITGLALIGVSYAVPEFKGNPQVQAVIMASVLGLSLAAVGIDLLVIRRLRKKLMEEQKPKKGAVASKGDKSSAADKTEKSSAADKRGAGTETGKNAKADKTGKGDKPEGQAQS